MNENGRRPLNGRALASMLMLFSGVGLPLSGIMNHVYQFDSIFGPRHAWMSAHNILGIIFGVSAICHALLNRRALGLYLRGHWAGGKAAGREAAVAALVVGAFLFLAVGHALHV